MATAIVFEERGKVWEVVKEVEGWRLCKRIVTSDRMKNSTTTKNSLLLFADPASLLSTTSAGRSCHYRSRLPPVAAHADSTGVASRSRGGEKDLFECERSNERPEKSGCFSRARRRKSAG